MTWWILEKELIKQVELKHLIILTLDKEPFLDIT